MPFPLAHPAAVLPLKRFCPRFLSFPALVAGSLSPDAGYLFRGESVSDISHSVLGGTGFGFVVGLLMILLLYSLGPTFIGRLLQSRAFRTDHPLEDLEKEILTMASARAVILSLLIGVWTHVLLDSFTHSDGWLVLHLELLRSPVATIGPHEVRICHLLWYACSFLGVAWLVMAFRSWQDNYHIGPTGRSRKSCVQEALIVAVFVLPIELTHHFVRSRLGLVLVVVMSVILVMAVMVGFAPLGQVERKGEEPDPGLLP
jgi:hypothetical protein